MSEGSVWEQQSNLGMAGKPMIGPVILRLCYSHVALTLDYKCSGYRLDKGLGGRLHLSDGQPSHFCVPGP